MNTIQTDMTLISAPLRSTNAIESATFAVVCQAAFDGASLELIATACESLSEDLPGVERPTGMMFNVGGPAGSEVSFGVQPTPPAVRRFRVNADASQAWVLQAQGNLLLVTCFDYTNWRDVWARANRYLTTMIRAVTTPIHLAEVGFQVVDKFICPEGGDRSKYDVNEVFVEACPYLTSKVKTSGHFWHVHQGWFEETEGLETEEARTLHQLNLTNGEEQLEQVRIATTIDHRGAVRFGQSGMSLQSLSLSHLSPTEQPLEIIFSQLKASHQIIIKQLLTPEKIRSIGMTP